MAGANAPAVFFGESLPSQVAEVDDKRNSYPLATSISASLSAAPRMANTPEAGQGLASSG
jgi:hypothetical protein